MVQDGVKKKNWVVKRKKIWRAREEKGNLRREKEEEEKEEKKEHARG